MYKRSLFQSSRPVVLEHVFHMLHLPISTFASCLHIFWRGGDFDLIIFMYIYIYIYLHHFVVWEVVSASSNSITFQPQRKHTHLTVLGLSYLDPERKHGKLSKKKSWCAPPIFSHRNHPPPPQKKKDQILPQYPPRSLTVRP